jgi:membrane fusion protein, heavy metal efflux system
LAYCLERHENIMNNRLLKHFVRIAGVQWRFAASLLIAFSGLVWAGPGHDHGDEKPAPAGAASPRLESHSDLFELVAVLSGGALTVYLDDYATNTPVPNAKIEYEFGAAKGVAAPQPDGTYRIESAALASATGTLPFSFTVIAGEKSDLLAGDLTLAGRADDHAHGPGDGHDHSSVGVGHSHTKAYAIGGGVLLVLIAAALFGWRKKRRSAFASAGVAVAASVVVLGLTWPAAGNAGPGHDHGDEAPAVSSNGPMRLPDGSVFLPKPSQRQLGVRTFVAVEASSPKSIQLNGRVIGDPAASGKVQPTQAGRLEAAAKAGRWPSLGERVSAGQVLAIVRPSVSAIERANQAALNAELAGNLDLAKRKLARLEQLEGTVPQREIEAARLEVQSLSERNRTVGASLGAVEVLRAPVSGVIAAVHASLGQVVDAREVVFEIMDPKRLLVEAMVFDPSLVARIDTASMLVGQDKLELKVQGAARTLRDGAVPVHFRVGGAGALALAVGQPVSIYAEGSESIKGVVVSASAVVKNPSNQLIVWKHETAERFVALPVTTQVLDAERIVITSGVSEGARIVTQGASFVNQVR